MDRFLEPMDMASLSGRGGGEREGWKFSSLGRFFECWCKADQTRVTQLCIYWEEPVVYIHLSHCVLI